MGTEGGERDGKTGRMGILLSFFSRSKMELRVSFFFLIVAPNTKIERGAMILLFWKQFQPEIKGNEN
jgi:DNA-binding SARP family transcriptional activator